MNYRNNDCDRLTFEIIRLSENMNENNEYDVDKCNFGNYLLYGLLFVLVCYVSYSVYDYILVDTYVEDEEHSNVDNLKLEKQLLDKNDKEKLEQQLLDKERLDKERLDKEYKEQQLLDKYNKLMELQKQINELMNKK
jgi:hypothetical protein